MELRQKLQQRKLLVPQLTQSLNILSLPLLDVKGLIDQELENNPLLELRELSFSSSFRKKRGASNLEFRASIITKKASLQDILFRQLGMFTNSEEDLKIGLEIIGNIDDNGYLQVKVEDIAVALNLPVEKIEKTLKLIQDFEPPGVAARSVSECLLIQLRLSGQNDPLLSRIISEHLGDLAKKNYTLIAKVLKEPLERIQPQIKKILKLDPKPGRNYSSEGIQHIIPDILVDETDEGLQISINNEDTSLLAINKDYQQMLKDNNLDLRTREFLKEKLNNALELLRAIAKRTDTLRRVVETIVGIQENAFREDLSQIKPLTFAQVAEKLNIHESTVCRAVMNKYVQTPYCGVVALKNFFASHIHNQNGETVSSNRVKRMIKELIEQENKTRPLSDQEICEILSKERNLKASRRTVAKYRTELKILSTAYRRQR